MTQTAMFPCPRCKNSRSNIEADCSVCGWSPNPSHAVHPQPTWEQPQLKTAHASFFESRALGWIAVAIGLATTLGGTMFFVVLQRMNDGSIPTSVSLFGAVQVGLGLLMAVAGLLIVYAQPFAKWLWIASALGVFFNAAYLLFVFLRLIQSV
jgi:hypothetical protein